MLLASSLLGLRHVAFVALLAGAAFVVGARVGGRRLGDDPLERAGLSIALGLGVLGHVALALGLLGALTPMITAAVLLVITIACWLGRPIGSSSAPPLVENPGPWRVVLRLGAGALVLGSFLLALYPPTQWDATSYHLPTARAFAESGRVGPLPYLRYPVFPRHAEMLMALGLLVGDEREAQLTEWMAMMAAALVIAGAGRRLFGARVGSWSAALWLGSPLVLLLGASAYVDVLVALFSTGAALLVVRAAEEDDAVVAALAGALAGFATSTKYTGLMVAALWGAVPLLARRKPRVIIAYAVAVLACGAPWYLLDLHWAKNPLFPFLRTQLGADPWWSAADHAGQMADLGQYGRGRGLLALVRLPVDLLLDPRAFHAEQILSPLLLVGVLAVLPALRARRLRPLAALLAVYVLAWFFGGAQVIRYLLPVVPLGALVVAAALGDLRERWGAWPTAHRFARFAPLVTALVTLLLLSAGAAWTAREIVQRGLPPSSTESRSAWLSARLPTYAALQHVTPERPGERLYQLELEDMTWHAPRQVQVMGDWFGPARYQPVLDALGDARQLHAALRVHGADWLLVPHPAFRGAIRLPVEDPHFAELFEACFDSRAAALYRVRAKPDGR